MYYVNSAPELINDQKTAKTVYFGLYLVNPRVQAAQNMCAKGGWRVFYAELRAAEVHPVFEEKKNVFAMLPIKVMATIFEIERANFNHFFP